MRKVKEEVSGCKESVDKMLKMMNIWESNFTSSPHEKNQFKYELDNLKKVRDERVIDIDKLERK